MSMVKRLTSVPPSVNNRKLQDPEYPGNCYDQFLTRQIPLFHYSGENAKCDNRSNNNRHNENCILYSDTVLLKSENLYR